MRYSTEPKYRKYVKGYDFLSSARKFGDEYGKNLMEAATNAVTDAKEKEDERQEIYIPPEKRQQIIDDLRLF